VYTSIDGNCVASLKFVASQLRKLSALHNPRKVHIVACSGCIESNVSKEIIKA
jgi:hypothetical protein